MTLSILAKESPLEILYKELEKYGFDYEPIPEVVTSYQGETVVIHHQGKYVLNINLHHLGGENYHLPILPRYASHPVMEYAIRLGLVNAIKVYAPAHVYRYTKGIGQFAKMKEQKTTSEKVFAKVVKQFVTSQLIERRNDNYLQGAFRFVISNSVEEAIWGFDESLLHELNEISRNRSNLHLSITMLDHENGPFVQHEIQAITEGLENENISVRERVIVRLLMQFGLRPIQLYLLREEDFVFDSIKGEYYLHIPRVKGKFARHRRKTFTTRGPLAPELAANIKELIGINQGIGTPEGCARALFITRHPRTELLSGPFHEYASHRATSFFKYALKRIERRLNIISRYTNERLHLTAYRFRYTLATTMVLNGYSQEDVAAALDHDSLESVSHYFRNTHEIAEYLDATISDSTEHQLATAKWAGFVDEDYPEGSTIHLEDIAGLGKCLNPEPCPYHPAVSCYGCNLFKPFKTANHQAALINIKAIVKDNKESSSGPVKQQLDYALEKVTVLVEQQKELLASE